MPLDALAGAYAGLTAIALATRRQRHALALPRWATAPRLRILGWALLCLSLVPLLIRLGGAQGVVAWIGIVGIAAIPLVLLLSRSPRAALLATVPLLLVGIASLFF